MSEQPHFCIQETRLMEMQLDVALHKAQVQAATDKINGLQSLLTRILYGIFALFGLSILKFLAHWLGFGMPDVPN